MKSLHIGVAYIADLIPTKFDLIHLLEALELVVRELTLQWIFSLIKLTMLEK